MPRNWGAELIAGLPEALTSPGTTALWEQALDDIAQGKLSLSSFMEKQKQWLNHLGGRCKAAATADHGTGYAGMPSLWEQNAESEDEKRERGILELPALSGV